MARAGNMYLRLWYFKRRNSKRFSVYVVLMSFFILFPMLFSHAERMLIPYIKEISESRIREIAAVSVSKTIEDAFAGRIKYEDAAVVSKDLSGRITAIQTNISFTNALSAKISSDLQERLGTLEKEDIRVPVGALLGNSVFAWMGPEFGIKVRPVGSIETGISSEFSSAGINQTRHRIVLNIKIRISSVMPAAGIRTEIETKVPIAETVIVGNVPSFYIDDQK